MGTFYTITSFNGFDFVNKLANVFKGVLNIFFNYGQFAFFGCSPATYGTTFLTFSSYTLSEHTLTKYRYGRENAHNETGV